MPAGFLLLSLLFNVVLVALWARERYLRSEVQALLTGKVVSVHPDEVYRSLRFPTES